MAQKYRAYKYTPAVLLATVFCSFIFYAYSTGITGVTLKNGNGCTCHSPSPTSGVIVTINGPDSIQVNQTAAFTVTITGGTLTRGGTNIAASAGVLATLNSDLQVIGGELTHVAPKAPVGGTITFQFNYTAPSTVGNQILYANGNSVNFNGNNEGDNWNFASNKNIVIVPPVPVELTALTASVYGDEVKLNWTTATEINNSGFEILRSRDNRNWDAAGFVSGAGNSTTINNYNFTDVNLKPGVYYYRLKQIDHNGTFELFNVSESVEVIGISNFALMQNYPNPFNPSTKIQYSVPVDGNVQLNVYNSLGKKVAELVNSYTVKGSYSADFNASDLSSGVYYYELKANDLNNNSFSIVKKMILIK